MSDLIMQITPPRANTRLGNTSLRSYLADTEILSPIRKRGLSGFKEHDMKRLRLDPSPTSDDRTILEYHSRVMELVPNDRTKINIRMPFTSTLEKLVASRRVRSILDSDRFMADYFNPQELSQKISSLERELRDVKNELQDVKNELQDAKNELQDAKNELQDAKNELQDVKNELHALKGNHLAMYQANMLARMIDIVYEKKGLQLPEGQGNDAARSSRKYTEAASRIGRENFERDFGLPLKYHDVLNKYSSV
jgi:Sec-independent protein translocase protein TatA